jgi:hypothetical protein
MWRLGWGGAGGKRGRGGKEGRKEGEGRREERMRDEDTDGNTRDMERHKEPWMVGTLF